MVACRRCHRLRSMHYKQTCSAINWASGFTESNILSGVVGVIAVIIEPVFVSRSLLTVRMRRVGSDWSLSGNTQKQANQIARLVQVVNPDPASDCTRPRASLPRSLFFSPASIASFPLSRHYSPFSLLFGNLDKDKNDLRRQSRRVRDGTRGVRAPWHIWTFCQLDGGPKK